jgi:hypothetical protein
LPALIEEKTGKNNKKDTNQKLLYFLTQNIRHNENSLTLVPQKNFNYFSTLAANAQ